MGRRKQDDILVVVLVLIGGFIFILKLIFEFIQSLFFTFIENWIIATPIAVFLGFILYRIIISIKKQKAIERKAYQKRMKIGEILALFASLEKPLHYLKEGKSLTTQKNNGKKVMTILNSINQYDINLVLEAIPNYEEFYYYHKSFYKMLTVTSLLTKAKKQEYLNKSKRELNYLKEILYEISEHQVTNSDFEILGLKNNFTYYTIELIKDRVALLNGSNSTKNSIKLN